MCTQYILCFCYYVYSIYIRLLLLCVLNIYYAIVIMCTQYILCFCYYVYSIYIIMLSLLCVLNIILKAFVIMCTQYIICFPYYTHVLNIIICFRVSCVLNMHNMLLVTHVYSICIKYILL